MIKLIHVLCIIGYPLSRLLHIDPDGVGDAIVKLGFCGLLTLAGLAWLAIYLIQHLHWA